MFSGQTIPAGLHVRLNLQTHKREAKLLDVPDKGSHYQKQTDSTDVNVEDEQQQTDGEEDAGTKTGLEN